MSDDNPENIVSNYLDEGDCEVEFIGIVDNRNTGFVGDTVINLGGIPWYIFLIYSFDVATFRCCQRKNYYSLKISQIVKNLLTTVRS
jgi:hypothetical protein